MLAKVKICKAACLAPTAMVKVNEITFSPVPTYDMNIFSEVLDLILHGVMDCTDAP